MSIRRKLLDRVMGPTQRAETKRLHGIIDELNMRIEMLKAARAKDRMAIDLLKERQVEYKQKISELYERNKEYSQRLSK